MAYTGSHDVHSGAVALRTTTAHMLHNDRKCTLQQQKTYCIAAVNMLCNTSCKTFDRKRVTQHKNRYCASGEKAVILQP